MSRAWLAANRALFARRMVVLYCDLDERRLLPAILPKAFKVKRINALSDLEPHRLEQITGVWNRKLASRNVGERFEKGAHLWLVECEDELAGYGWTLRGRTIEPYYFPLTPEDVHFFDFHIFPGYRGRGLNPLLVGHMLERLAKDGNRRAFIEAAEWNHPQLNSLRKTPFRRLGLASIRRTLSRTSVSWTGKTSRLEQIENGRSDVLRPMNNPEQKTCEPPKPVKLHHIGFVVRSIEKSGESFARSLGATWDGNIVFDPLQRVRVTFVEGAHPNDCLIELVEPGEPESPVSEFLERGGGLHHLCYEVDDIAAHLTFCKSVGTIVIRQPVPAVAFGGRRIAWALTRKRLLVEYLESRPVAL